MGQASFRFYAELNDFLPTNHRQKILTYPFELSASVKDMIEALGVPHTEMRGYCKSAPLMSKSNVTLPQNPYK